MILVLQIAAGVVLAYLFIKIAPLVFDQLAGIFDRLFGGQPPVH